MTALVWWFNVVGALYLLMALLSIGPRVPIKAEGPPGILDRAAEGDPTARFVLDTWTMFGLYIGAVGIALIIASFHPSESRSLVWTVLGMELIGGIGIDVYKLMRGYRKAPPIVWIIIHTLVIASGWHFLK